MQFLIAYDIAEPGRLRRVAHHFERSGHRVQKSVFFFAGTASALTLVMRECLEIIDIHEDVVQSWPIASITSAGRLDFGSTVPTQPACMIVGRNQTYVLEDKPCLNG